MTALAMKHALRDLSIAILSWSGASSLYRYVLARQHPLVRIVVFHDTGDGEWFESMVRTLTETYAIISPEDFGSGKYESARTNVLITFDDGYASWVTVALPILKKYDVKGLFFISSGLPDVALDSELSDSFMREALRITPRPALSWDGVRELVDAGHTIGGHARTHRDLTKLEEDNLRSEIVSDKAALEAGLGRPVNDFAYPFGTKKHLNSAVIEAVQEAGYQRAYTAISRFVRPGETFRIPRMCIESGLSSKALIRWVGGCYDLFVMFK